MPRRGSFEVRASTTASNEEAWDEAMEEGGGWVRYSARASWLGERGERARRRSTGRSTDWPFACFCRACSFGAQKGKQGGQAAAASVPTAPWRSRTCRASSWAPRRSCRWWKRVPRPRAAPWTRMCRTGARHPPAPAAVASCAGRGAGGRLVKGAPPPQAPWHSPRAKRARSGGAGGGQARGRVGGARLRGERMLLTL